jgi:dipeptidyl aminopeptidase/acylaminoacyl peptidase
MHTVSLVDLDDRCELVGEASRVLFVYPRQRQALTFHVACLLPGQLVVKTQTTGQRNVSDPYRVTLDGGAGVSIDPDGELRFELHPQAYQVALSTLDARCLVANALQQATVLESSTVTIQFQVRCYPDPPGLSGEKLVVSFNSATGSGLYAIDPDGGRRFNIDGDGSGAGDPAVSADGRRLAFRRYSPDGSNLVVLDVATGARSVSAGKMNISGLSWAPDGQRLVTGLTNDGTTSLVVLRADGSLERTLGLRDAASLSAHWSPDGRTIAVTRSNHEVMLVNADGSNVRALTSSSDRYLDGGDWSPDGSTLLVRSYKQYCYYYSGTATLRCGCWSGRCDRPGDQERPGAGVRVRFKWEARRRSILHRGG